MRISLLLLALLPGCASRLYVKSDYVTVELRNSTDKPQECRGILYAETSTGELRNRKINTIVRPGIPKTQTLFADEEDHFIDAWRQIQCVVHPSVLQISPR